MMTVMIRVKLIEKLIDPMKSRATVKNHSDINQRIPYRLVFTATAALENCRASFGTKKSIDFRPKSALSNESNILIVTYSV